jgi:hypothetical protein
MVFLSAVASLLLPRPWIDQQLLQIHIRFPSHFVRFSHDVLDSSKACCPFGACLLLRLFTRDYDPGDSGSDSNTRLAQQPTLKNRRVPQPRGLTNSIHLTPPSIEL